jgi:hypothetical protein
MKKRKKNDIKKRRKTTGGLHSRKSIREDKNVRSKKCVVN